MSPTSFKNCAAGSLTESIVSKAIGWNVYDSVNVAYLACFLDPAISAEAPAADAEAEMHESASVVATVTSHVSDRPLYQGINLRPSGRLPSLGKRPEGSFMTGI